MVVVIAPTLEVPIFVFADREAWQSSDEWKQCTEKCGGVGTLVIEAPSRELSEAIKEAQVVVLVCKSDRLADWVEADLSAGLAAYHAAGRTIFAVGPVCSLLGSFYLSADKKLRKGWDMIRQSVCNVCSTLKDWDSCENVLAALHKHGHEQIKGYGIFAGAAFFPNGDGSRAEAIGKQILEASSIPKAESFGKLLKLRKIIPPDHCIVRSLAVDPAHRWEAALDMCAKFLVDSKGTAVASTGAGMSAESGIPTYRDPGGLWEIYDQMEVSHIKGFAQDPLKCWRFELELSQLLKRCGPNAGHFALQQLEALGVLKAVVTQNVDGLHLAAGSQDVLEIHGSETRGICMNVDCRSKVSYLDVFRGLGWIDNLGSTTAAAPPLPSRKREQMRGGVYAELTDSSSSTSSSPCSSSSSSDESSPSSASSKASKGPIKFKSLVEKLKARASNPQDIEKMSRYPRCPSCKDGMLKPDAVYFGEPLSKHVLKRAVSVSKESKAFLIVGTSGQVAPACKLPLLAKKGSAAKVIEISPRETDMSKDADILLLGSAAMVLPALVEAVRRRLTRAGASTVGLRDFSNDASPGVKRPCKRG